MTHFSDQINRFHVSPTVCRFPVPKSDSHIGTIAGNGGPFYPAARTAGDGGTGGDGEAYDQVAVLMDCPKKRSRVGSR